MSQANIELGSYIKRFRQDKGMSIRELAKRAEITPSMLSQIERDLATPSINTLKALAVELDVPIYRFFQADGGPQEDLVVRKDSRKWLGDSARNIAYELLVPDVRGSIEFCLMHIPPKGDGLSYSMSHEGEEVSYVLSGKTEVLVDGICYTLESGDSIRIPPGVHHGWKNPFNETCDVIFAVTPPSF